MSTEPQTRTALLDISNRVGNLSPTPSTTTSTGNQQQISIASENDFFDKAFHIPLKAKVMGRRMQRAIRSRPPVVASSYEYKKYYEQLEVERLTREHNREAKKAMRSAQNKNKTAEK